MVHTKVSLDDIEKHALLQVAESGFHVVTLPDFNAWISGPVNAFFPHERMVCAIGQLFGEEIRIRHLLGVNCPPECIERFDRITSFRERGMVQRWLSQYRAQIVNAADMRGQLSPEEHEDALRVGASNLAVFGCLDSGGQGGTYVSFSGVPGQLTARHAFKLELLMPYLHMTVTRIFHRNGEQAGETAQRSAKLTRREQEILALMSTGMSNRAIAERLSRSELTVQNHVHAIFKKLGVRNRVAAVATYRSVLPLLAETRLPGEQAVQSRSRDAETADASCLPGHGAA
ncbi:MAG TPA: response regulator transcription factor [Noviherbaspirillum sp.]|nr:response regulator transcription factor [Noviherbaspirillum sp.]